MLDTLAKLGCELVEIACGNWSRAPHINLDEMLSSEQARKTFMEAIESRGLKLEALNCSGNQLAPNEEDRQHQEVVEKTFRLAGLLGVKKIVMMSGCPGGSPTDSTPNWIITSWPPIATKILNWQWEEVLIPYRKKTVELARANGIEKIALGHGHDVCWWKKFLSVLSMEGYDGPISQEMEDLTMPALTGVKKSTDVLKEAMPCDYDV